MPSSAKRPKAVERWAIWRGDLDCYLSVGEIDDDQPPKYITDEDGCSVERAGEVVRVRIVPVPLNRTRHKAEPDAPKGRRTWQGPARKPRRRAARRKA